MRTLSLLSVMAVAIGLAIGPGRLSAGEIQLTGEWWRGPAVQTRYTSLVASFESTVHCDADVARGNPASGGFGIIAFANGHYGDGARTGEQGAHLNFLAQNNFNPYQGTLRISVRGGLWQDTAPRWLWEARGEWRIGVRRDTNALSLLIHESTDTKRPPVAQVSLPVASVSTNEWHTVVASWDRGAGTGTIALDGRGITEPLTFPASYRDMFVLYVAGGFSGLQGGANEAGMEFDELEVYDRPVSMLERKPDPLPERDLQLLPQVETGARKTLNFQAGLQRLGGWMGRYTWPTLLGSSAQGREYVEYDDCITNDKSHATSFIASRFLYAWQVLGDARFLDVALKTAEYLLAAQDPRGFWVHQYRITAGGIKSDVDESFVKLQDSNTSHPMMFLTALYHATQDQRYLDAVKRAGEFYLHAQNPNGSWSHHWDAKAGIGKTESNRDNQGGELNDRAMNDGIDIMALMYHLTKDRRYSEAIRKAGDWVIAAQMTGATRGWAQQYDSKNRPVQARHFEPPAMATRSIGDAVRCLVEVYRFTGDQKYLQPGRECLTWLERTFPDGSVWPYLEPETGRGIGQWQYKIYYLDDPEDYAAILKTPTGGTYEHKSTAAPRLRRMLDEAEAPSVMVPQVTREYASQRLNDVRPGALESLSTQNEAGVWVEPVISSFMGSLGRGFQGACSEVVDLLLYIEAARMIRGEIPLQYRGDCEMLRMVWPKADWYDVGLK